MWVIFHEDKSRFTYIDKNVFGVVEDKDILEFQDNLTNLTGQIGYPLIECTGRLQNFVGTDYFARHYVPMTPRVDMIVQSARPKSEIPTISLFRDEGRQSLYNIEQ